jgi:hypothetical protein
MNNIDHMLNGKGSRQHHQDVIRWVQQDRLAQKAATVRNNQKTVSRVRATLIAIINMIGR